MRFYVLLELFEFFLEFFRKNLPSARGHLSLFPALGEQILSLFAVSPPFLLFWANFYAFLRVKVLLVSMRFYVLPELSEFFLEFFRKKTSLRKVSFVAISGSGRPDFVAMLKSMHFYV